MAVHNAGLVGMGGAGFPTRVKIEPNPAMPKELLLINGCECEPFITCDYRIMLEWTWQILAGVRLAAKASGVNSIFIAIEDNKPAAIEQMNEAVRLFNWQGIDRVSVLPVETRYPQGGERQLINTVLKKQVPTGGIPPQIGICVLNAATCAAIAEAVVKGAPLTHRTVSVTGGAIARPGNYYAPIGMKVQDLIEYAGGLTKSAAKVIMGGPMTGAAVADLSTPIMKTTGSLTLLAMDEVQAAKYARQETPCIRCGRCLSVCPEHINPTKIAHAVKHFRMDMAEQYFMSACIECGCCSYICPANIELTGYIKTGKLLKARAARRVP
jgi:electron transport complex protein RnfC